MTAETISSQRELAKEISFEGKGESEAMKTLREDFGSYFKPKEFEKISKNPDSLYFNLSQVFLKLGEEGKFDEIPSLQELALKILVKERTSEQGKTFEFPAKKPTFLERMRDWPKSLRAALLGLGMLTVSAIALDGGDLLAKPKAKIEVAKVAKPEKPRGAICTENMCQLVVREKGFSEKKADLERFLREDVGKISTVSPEDREATQEYLEQTYYFLKNELSDQEKNDPEVKAIVLEIEKKLGIGQ